MTATLVLWVLLVLLILFGIRDIADYVTDRRAMQQLLTNFGQRFAQEFDMPLVARMLKARTRRIPERLVIRYISNRRAVRTDSIGNRRRRVIQVLRFNENVADPEEAFFKFCKVDPA